MRDRLVATMYFLRKQKSYHTFKNIIIVASSDVFNRYFFFAYIAEVTQN